MLNVALLIDNHPNEGGIVQYNQAILEAFDSLDNSRYNKTVFYTNNFWKNYLIPYELNKQQILLTKRQKNILKLLVYLGLTGKWTNVLLFFLNFKIFRSIRKKNFDIIIFPSQDIIPLFIKSNFISSVHDLMHRYESRFPEVSNKGRYQFREKYFSSIVKKSIAILVDSEVGKNQIIESYNGDAKKIYALPYIPPKHILSYVDNSTEFNKLYQLPIKFLFYPAQFWEHKNHKNLLKAIAIVKKKYSDIAIVFSGKKDYNYHTIKELIAELNLESNTFFMGFIPNEHLGGIYKRARALVMPSFFGPTNIPPLEANYLGCPAIVSDIYAAREQLKDAALYFDPSKPEDIAEKIIKVWENDILYNSLVNNGLNLSSKWAQLAFNKRFNQIIYDVLFSSKKDL